jgi:AcrR family transcriptional regulator
VYIYISIVIIYLLERNDRLRLEAPIPESRSSPDLNRRARGARTRERLLAAAIDLIAERGYAATTVAEVCRRAGTAAPALYHHFESKEGLLAAVVDRVGNTWIEEIQKYAYREHDLHQRLDRTFESWQAIVAEQPQLLRLLIAVQLERRDASPPVRETIARLVERSRSRIVETIEDSLGSLPDLDLVAHTMIALLEGALLQHHLDPEGTDLDRLFREMRRTVWLVLADRLAQAHAEREGTAE